MYYIYRITNKLNNKTYIGQHKYKDLSVDTYMGSGKYLWNAYNKYGIENFEKEILISEIETKEEINKLEKEYIKLERNKGHSEYNISNGGEGWNMSGENHYLYGKHIPIETRKKMSEAQRGENHYNYGKPRSEETRKKISESTIGENNHFYGKHHTEETKKRMSYAKKYNKNFYGKHHTEEAKKKISESKRGKHLSEEHRKKISESKKGNYHSDESKRRMSEAQRGKKCYNNGIECHMYIPGTEPEGYMLGKLK